MMRFTIFFLFNLIAFSPEMAKGQITSLQSSSIDSLFAEHANSPGCGLGIYQDGEVLYQKGYGLSNLEDSISIDKYTVFEVASLTKQFTAAGIFLLELDGKLSVSDPIQKYIPEFPVYQEGTITIDHLVHHTSGLREYLNLLYCKGLSWDLTFTNQDALELMVAQRGTNFPPGSRYAYSNTGYMLLSVIIERVSGKTYRQFLEERIFGPLGMQNSTVSDDEKQIIENRAIGYQWVENGFQQEHYFQNTVTGDGGVCTTVEDFFIWSENLKTGTLGGDAFLEKMLTVGRLSSREVTPYAGGLFLGDYQNIAGIPTIGHSGEWAGFRSLFFKFEKQDLTFVIFSNHDHVNVWSLLSGLVPMFISPEVLENNRAADPGSKLAMKTIAPHQLKKYMGLFFNPLNGYTREIDLIQDTLVYRRGNGRETKLLALTDSEFVFLGAPWVRIKFSDESSKSDLKLQIGDDAPIHMERFETKNFTQQELSKLEGSYYSKELDVFYDLKKTAAGLTVYVGDKRLVELAGIKEGIFNEEHFGFLKFSQDDEETLSFTMNSELIRDIKFLKISSL